MQSIKLNFQQSQKQAWKKPGWLLVMLGLGLNAFLFAEHQEALSTKEAYVSKLEVVSDADKKKLVANNNDQDFAQKNRLKQAGKVMRQLNMPWPALFNHLEATRETNITLLEFTPNTQTEEVLLVGQAENLKTVFDYMDRLKNGQIFTKVELNSHEKNIQQGANVLRFTILAKWQTDDE